MRPFLAVSLLLACGLHVFADDASTFPTADLFKRGDFETPAIKGRTPMEKGADLTNGLNPAWVAYETQPKKQVPANGKIVAGLTDEVAHGGKQSLYIDFQHVKTPYQAVTLTTNFVPIVSGSLYQVNIWGRSDPRALIPQDARPAYLKLEVDFYAADANQSVGDPFYSVLPIGGDPFHTAFFKPNEWKEFFAKVYAPKGAVFAQMIWSWESAGADAGEINGTLFFDDVTVIGAPNPHPDMTPAPIQETTPAPDDTGTDAGATGTDAQPAPSPGQ